jgi:hypothetical protein
MCVCVFVKYTLLIARFLRSAAAAEQMFGTSLSLPHSLLSRTHTNVVEVMTACASE